MSVPIFTVKKAGLFTTIQDSGRRGYQSLGIPVAGVMDTFSHRISNIIVGNGLNAAVLEVTLVGPHLYVENDVIASICGADLSPKINGSSVPMWTSLHLKRGDLLTFGKNVSGTRAYISVAGEFALPFVFGSQSTETKTKLGGYFGRPLQKGDTLFRKRAPSPRFFKRRMLKREDIPTYSQKMTVRLILGPHLDFFTNDSIQTLLTESYTVSFRSDRMGYRLEGPNIQLKKNKDLRSEATTFGSIQVPASGQPIILMADRQTTGGYPIIGTVISVDIPKLAQARPGSEITFKQTTVEEAQAQFRKRETWFYLLEKLYKAE
ncbi:biotin-dependent carboxyltransferase family protein [Pueribacillus sp. YX66]|uniref:5-oxoprolinase subunit C family protein n=1 Tax=Pueribacillus sp. YX66 TaxID=3229242 RepID=UPI00358D7F7B